MHNHCFSPRHHNRHSLRLKGYDYTQPGLYFVTICTSGLVHQFGKISDEKMELNNLGQIVSSCWLSIPKYYPQARLDEFVIMPNHLHGIIGFHRGPKMGSLGQVVGAFKSASAKQCNKAMGKLFAPLWHRNYFEHIIRDKQSLNMIREYIRKNPARWERDRNNLTPDHFRQEIKNIFSAIR